MHIAQAGGSLPHNRPPSNVDTLHAFSTGSQVVYNDFYSFDLVTAKWTRLINDTQRPSARYKHGFISMGGRLYVHGGYNNLGNLRANVLWMMRVREIQSSTRSRCEDWFAGEEL